MKLFIVLASFAIGLGLAQDSHAQSYREFVLEPGQTVSGIVYDELKDGSKWHSDSVIVLHKDSERVYAKDDLSMSRLPVGSRVRISDDLYPEVEARVVSVASEQSRTLVAPGSMGTARQVQELTISVVPVAPTAASFRTVVLISATSFVIVALGLITSYLIGKRQRKQDMIAYKSPHLPGPIHPPGNFQVRLSAPERLSPADIHGPSDPLSCFASENHSVAS